MVTSQTQQYHRSQLFLLRLWVEEGSEGDVEWQGRVQHVVTGEARSFTSWPTLVELLIQMLPVVETEQSINNEGGTTDEP
jgi:hypothetical protein